ncbi:outer membrane protein assembly factor BamA, partial [Desulfovibrio sp. OttesenSCG-928-G15]|nr:outer membrane protein assembly factor BamA [Desulfovibrio sp. OttesenSCG-928-G15]
MSRRAEQGHFSPVSHRMILVALALFLLTGGMTVASPATAAKAKAKGSRVLVLPFQVHADNPDATSDAEFTEMLTRRIGAHGVSVVSQAEMQKALASKKISSLDAAAIRKLAAATGASHVVYGSVNQVGSAMSVDARMVSTNASEPPKPMFVEQKSGQANMGYAMDELAGAVANEMPAPPINPIVEEGSAPAAAHTGRAAGHKAGGIAGVEVRGTKVLDPDVVMMRISTRRGDRPDAVSIDQDIKQIWDLGYFSDVSVNTEQRSDGTHLVYTVVERPKVDTITVNGTDELDEDDVTSAMATKTGSVLSESVLADDITKVLELYRKKGFYLAKIDTAQTPSANGTTNLTLNITEGKQLYIKEVKIDGITELDEGDVKDQLMLTERGILSWMTGKGILKEELIERDSSVINAYYLDRGYMDITVAPPKIDYEDDGIRVTFPVHEGPKYKLGNVTYNGDLIVTEDKLRNVTKMDKLAAEGG